MVRGSSGREFEPADAILFQLLPSRAEVLESSADDEYTGNLTSFWDSIDALLQGNEEPSLRDYPINIVTDLFTSKGRCTARSMPPEVCEFLYYVATLSPLAVYKVLKVWADLKKGRRIKVAFRDMEIEVTQMSDESFLSLLSALQEYCDNDEVFGNTSVKAAKRADLIKKLRDKQVTIYSDDEPDRSQYELRNLYRRGGKHHK